MELRGQVSLEFLASMFIFLMGVGASLTFVTGELPEFRESVRASSINLDATKMSNRMLTKSGSHSIGGDDWEKNSTTRSNIEAFGFASDYLVLEEDKVQAVDTVGANANYSQFRELENPEYQYNFVFTWFPLVHTSENFEKGDPPAKPSITEPSNDYYDDAEPEVHYGSTRIHGTTYRFLSTSYLSQYNTTYVSTDWDFDTGTQGPLGSSDVANLGGKTFQIESLQNRGGDEGELVVLKRQVKEFGASVPQSSNTIKLTRYGVYNASDSDDHPMKIEVIAW